MRRIAGVEIVDRRKMDDLREDLVIEKCLMGRLVKTQMKWVRHVERINKHRLRRMAYYNNKSIYVAPCLQVTLFKGAVSCYKIKKIKLKNAKGKYIKNIYTAVYI